MTDPTTDGTASLTLIGGPEDETLAGGAARDMLVGAGGADSLSGGGGDDLLYGGAGSSFQAGAVALAMAEDGADQLSGGAGNDLLDGGAGADTLRGGAGDDTLIGGIGGDRMTGGAGHDLFRFGLTPLGPDAGMGPGARDVITDFTPGEDLIDLRGWRGDLGTPDVALTFLGEGPMAVMAHGAVRVEMRADGAHLLLDLDLPGQAPDGVADAEIVLKGLTQAPALGDFLL